MLSATVEGLIFLAELTPLPPGGFDELAASIRAAKAKGGDDLDRLLRCCNWLEVPYLFADRRDSAEEVALLAQVIADASRLRLRGLYPERNFEVRVLRPSETGSVIGVRFVELQSP